MRNGHRAALGAADCLRASPVAVGVRELPIRLCCRNWPQLTYLISILAPLAPPTTMASQPGAIGELAVAQEFICRLAPADCLFPRQLASTRNPDACTLKWAPIVNLAPSSRVAILSAGWLAGSRTGIPPQRILAPLAPLLGKSAPPRSSSRWLHFFSKLVSSAGPVEYMKCQIWPPAFGQYVAGESWLRQTVSSHSNPWFI